MLDLKREAADIARAARALSSGPARRCKLRDQTVVLRLLVAFRAGLRQTEAARAAGVSEAALRLWLQEGATAESGPYALLRRAVDAIQWQEAPSPPRVSVVLPEAVRLTPVVSSPAPAMPPPPIPTPAKVVVTPQRVQALIEDMERVRLELACLPALEDRTSEQRQRGAQLRARLDALTAEMQAITAVRISA